MSDSNKSEVIDLRIVFKKIMERKRLFLKVLPVVFVLSCLYIICIPRTYITDCRLAPEAVGSVGGGALGSLASSVGIDLTQIETNDAITPMLYPDLMDDNKFVVSLFNIDVTKSDGSLNTTYYNYLREHQAYPWWTKGIVWVKNLFKSDDRQDAFNAQEGEQSAYILAKADDDVANAIRSKVNLGVDKKTGVISILVEDQDPLICKTIADSVSAHLQQFITEYRTNKARVDLEYYEQLTANAKDEYDKLRRQYNAFVDANKNIILQSYKSKQQDMESELALKFQTYTTLTTMYQQALGKVQERTPAFTILKGAEMPLKAAKPKRMIFVIGMVFCAAFAICVYSLKDLILKE